MIFFKFLIELCPLIGFFVGYKIGGIEKATIYMVIASVSSLTTYFLIYRRIEKVTLFSSLLLLTSAGVTLATGNPIFIKMKPTILYLISAAVLYSSIVRKRPLIKYVIGDVIVLKDDMLWNNLSYRFIAFFLSFAVINEYLWRNYSEATWVKFKVFGMAPLLILFMMLQVPFLLRNKKED